MDYESSPKKFGVLRIFTVFDKASITHRWNNSLKTVHPPVPDRRKPASLLPLSLCGSHCAIPPQYNDTCWACAGGCKTRRSHRLALVGGKSLRFRNAGTHRENFFCGLIGMARRGCFAWRFLAPRGVKHLQKYHWNSSPLCFFGVCVK